MKPSDQIAPLAARAWQYARAHPILVAFFLIRHLFVIGAAALSIAYVGFAQSQKAAADLSDDFSLIAQSQDNFVGAAIDLQTRLFTKDEKVDLPTELTNLRLEAESSLTSLTNLRAPTRSIDTARYQYRTSLEELIGTVNFILREGADGQAIRLHNALQTAANNGGELRSSIERFQGGAVPQVLGGIF